MKKKIITVMLAVAMTASLLAGCGSSSSTSTATADTAAAATSAAATEATSEATAAATSAGAAAATEATGGMDATGKTFAIVVKSAGNPYNEKEIEGFKAVIEAAGGTCISKEPEAATADAQVSVIQSLISQGVNSISIAANDENALQSALQDAMNAGIKVSCFDSKVNADSRQTFVNQAGTQEIGQALMDAVLDISGGSGQFAILSATSQATNQNAWIAAMEAELEKDSRGLELVKIAYGDDEFQKSVDETEALLKNYPDLKAICAPTTVGIMAAGKVLQDKGSACKLTGLGLPSEMADYIGADKSCPYMFLWNPIDIGRLAGYTAMALVGGQITGAEGESFTAGTLGDYTIVAAADGGTELILGPPFEFNPENIEEWKTVY